MLVIAWCWSMVCFTSPAITPNFFFSDIFQSLTKNVRRYSKYLGARPIRIIKIGSGPLSLESNVLWPSYSKLQTSALQKTFNLIPYRKENLTLSFAYTVENFRYSKSDHFPGAYSRYFFHGFWQTIRFIYTERIKFHRLDWFKKTETMKQVLERKTSQKWRTIQ